MIWDIKSEFIDFFKNISEFKLKTRKSANLVIKINLIHR